MSSLNFVTRTGVTQVNLSQKGPRTRWKRPAHSGPRLGLRWHRQRKAGGHGSCPHAACGEAEHQAGPRPREAGDALVGLSRRSYPQFRDKNRRDAGKSQSKRTGPRTRWKRLAHRPPRAHHAQQPRLRHVPHAHVAARAAPLPRTRQAPRPSAAPAPNGCLIEAPWMVNGGHGASSR
eukprot:COSAG01_NODE_744_length_13876_cov_4.660449_22_plen_177_part_00